MGLFKKKHICDFEITHISNVIQFDEMGYPLRLVIVKCKHCGKTDQQWIDTNKRYELKPNEVECKWEKIGE